MGVFLARKLISLAKTVCALMLRLEAAGERSSGGNPEDEPDPRNAYLYDPSFGKPLAKPGETNEADETALHEGEVGLIQIKTKTNLFCLAVENVIESEPVLCHERTRQLR